MRLSGRQPRFLPILGDSDRHRLGRRIRRSRVRGRHFGSSGSPELVSAAYRSMVETIDRGDYAVVLEFGNRLGGRASGARRAWVALRERQHMEQGQRPHRRKCKHQPDSAFPGCLRNLRAVCVRSANRRPDSQGVAAARVEAFRLAASKGERGLRRSGRGGPKISGSGPSMVLPSSRSVRSATTIRQLPRPPGWPAIFFHRRQTARHGGTMGRIALEIRLPPRVHQRLGTPCAPGIGTIQGQRPIRQGCTS